MKFAFYTLGCKTNQYETQAMERLLTEKGHEIGRFEEPCDGYVVNTCSVTAVADKKNRNYLYLIFMFIMMLSMFTEDTIETQIGVTLFAFFNSFLVFAMPLDVDEKSSESKQQIREEIPDRRDPYSE